MEKTKLTKKDYFEKIKGVCADNADIVAFCDHEIELLAKKNSSKGNTKTQKENENIKVAIVNALRDIARPVTISELQAENSDMAQYTNQKLSALLTQLTKAENAEVVKTTDKKKSYFSVVD